MLKKDAQNEIYLEEKQEYNGDAQKVFSKFGPLFWQGATTTLWAG